LEKVTTLKFTKFISVKGANNGSPFTPDAKITFSMDGSLCAYLSPSSNKLYFFRVPFPFKNDARVSYTTEIDSVINFNWWTSNSVIVCDTSGEMAVREYNSKLNILGMDDTKEEVEGFPLITNVHNGKFYLLEYDPNKE